MVAAFIVIIYYSIAYPLETMLPAFPYLFTAICMFIYQSMDAIDGKQARRTGSTGPLGELFDHGCDALNMILQSLIMPILFRITSPYLIMHFPVLGKDVVCCVPFHQT